MWLTAFSGRPGWVKHGEDLADLVDGAGVGPLFGKDGVNPDGTGKGFGR